MAVSNNSQSRDKSLVNGILSVLLPGLGQLVAREIGRGIFLLASILILGWLSIWTIAQRARFPDLVVSREIFVGLPFGPDGFTGVFWQCVALLVFLIALRYLVNRFVIKDAAGQAFTGFGLGIIYFFALLLVLDSMLELAGSEEQLSQVFGLTGVLSAGALAALYLWQVRDAVQVGRGEQVPSLTPSILIGCVVILSLGWNITKIDLEKAIAEYQDTRIILRRIVWPWRSAFEFSEITVESTARIQAPCPEGATGPPPNEPLQGEAWVVVTPTCGEISSRDLGTGTLSLGTELSITGGGFMPGSVVEILWKNPIGNPFKPRGVGETDITIDSQGEFETVLNIPEVVIASTAVGDQLHTLVIRQESGEVFTGNPSRELKLALEGMLETIMIGLMATFFGVILAFPFSFFAARNLMAPISSPLMRIVGGLVLLVPAIYLAAMGTGYVAEALGGLDEAPVQIAVVGFALVVGIGSLGSRAGSGAFDLLANRTMPVIGKSVTGLGLGVLAAGFGFILGIGISRGIVAIPLGEEVAVLTESNYAVGGAILLGAIGLVYGYLNAYNEFSIGMVIYSITRTIMNIVRSIEPLIWAIIGTIWVGLGPFAGTIALTLHTIAALGKLYSESIESIDSGPIEALQATGANRLQTIVYAVVPQILPPFISFTIYRWDINVRMSTIIGAVGGGGIGFILIQWIRQFQYDAAGIAVWLITITVATLDYVSSNIRERYV